MSFEPGDLIGDRYELGRQLGAGGMARVYLGHDRLLDRKVAVKVLSEPYASDPQFVERFRREASAAAGLNHPNIVAVYDRGEADGSYYIVMEYLKGPDLKQVIRARAPLPPLEAIDNAQQILAALGAAHKRDVVHRDVKPQNVLVAEDGHLKVTDFGIARAGAESDMTEAGSVIGTAQYLSPEQARGDDVTAASDCYAVGIVLYEMLTGRVPFDGGPPVAVAMKQITDEPVSPRIVEPSVPRELETVVLRALAKRPSERYRTAEEMSRALAEVRGILDGSGGTTRVIPAGAGGDTGRTRVLGPPPAATRVGSAAPRRAAGAAALAAHRRHRPAAGRRRGGGLRAPVGRRRRQDGHRAAGRGAHLRGRPEGADRRRPAADRQHGDGRHRRGGERDRHRPPRGLGGEGGRHDHPARQRWTRRRHGAGRRRQDGGGGHQRTEARELRGDDP